MNQKKSNEIDTIYGEGKLKITCVERKYKVEMPEATFMIAAKAELDEDATGKLLQEDMELKTFLANYEITNVILPNKIPIADTIVEVENIKLIKRGSSEKTSELGVAEKRKVNINERRILAEKRRSIFDSLDLPEEFTSRNYVDALKKKGITTTNSAMPYDDLSYLQKKEKIIKLKKTARGAQIFKRIKIDDTRIENKMFI